MKDEPWEPATSKPGEVFTPEGQIKSYGAVARGLVNSDPRARRYQRSIMAPAFVFIGIAGAVVLLSVVL